MRNTRFNPASSSSSASSQKPLRSRPPLSDAQRRDELARLLPLWPREIANLTLAGRRHIIRTLERALRAERRRGRAGHWAYDLSRHVALLQSWRLECAALRDIENRTHDRPTKSPPVGGRF